MTRTILAACAAAALLVASPAFGQVQRTFVASYGNDINTASNCGLAQPCRSFAAAQSATADGGEIVALDAAGYGAITITQSISILANPGVYAGISASSGNAITIATPGVHVRLSGLRLNGLGASNGIVMTAGESLVVENCTVSGFSQNGIWAQALESSVTVADTLVVRNLGFGVYFWNRVRASVVNLRAVMNNLGGLWVDAAPGLGTNVTVTRSVAAMNGTGFGVRSNVAGGVGRLTVTGSSADHNDIGFYARYDLGVSAGLVLSNNTATRNTSGVQVTGAGASAYSAGNNTIADNEIDVGGVLTAFPTM